MQIVTILGVLFFILSLVLGIQSLVYKIIGRALEGFTTVIIIELLVGSICMTSMGIIGYYISKIYDEIKGRPRYIISNIVSTNISNIASNDAANNGTTNNNTANKDISNIAYKGTSANSISDDNSCNKDI